MLRQPVLHLQVLLVLALLLGGGGIVYGVRHFLIQAFALLLLALHAGQVARFLREGPRALVLLVAASTALPLLQILPLPPGLWQELPGRDLVVQSLELAGLDADRWMPFSLDPVRTALAFCATLAPATMVVLGQGLSRQHRVRLAATALVAALLILLLGVVQLSSANTILMTQWIRPDADVLYSTFSNRNSGGIFFVMAAIAALALPRPPGKQWWPMAIGSAVALLVLGAVLTQSRTSMALVMVIPALLALKAIGWRRARGRAADYAPPRWQVLTMAALTAAIAAGLIGSLLSGGRVADSLARFEVIQQDRLERWDDATYSIDRFWPVGAGTGTFDDVFQVDESLEYLSIARAGRAHNDYLEIVIETGVVGPILLLAWLAWCLAALSRPAAPEDRWLRLCAFAALGCIVMQSLLDYPLRNQALLMMAAMWIVLLSPAAVERRA